MKIQYRFKCYNIHAWGDPFENPADSWWTEWYDYEDGYTVEPDDECALGEFQLRLVGVDGQVLETQHG